MNTELQKKWFVYLSDHHEGPFSASELEEKQKIGLVTSESYVWKEGMSDWKPLTEVAELVQHFKKFDSEKIEINSPSPTIKKVPLKNKLPIKKLVLSTFATLILCTTVLAIMSRTNNEELHSSLRPTLNKIVDRAPMLAPLFHLVPGTGELSTETRKELEAAQLGPPEKIAKISIALSQSDPLRPCLFVSSNLPDRTKFDVYIIGKSETLLNRLQHQSQTLVTLNHGLAKSEVLLTDGGQPLAKGEYQIWVTESLESDGSIKEKLINYPPNRPSGVLPAPLPNSAKFVTGLVTFIGGLRDENYLTRLKAFHEKIKESSEKELLELQQYLDTIETQFRSITLEFEKILRAKKPNPGTKERWKDYSSKWNEINQQLEQVIQTWSTETLRNEFFYGSAYEITKGAFESLKNLYRIEDAFVENASDRNAFEIQHGKAMSEVQLSLDQLRGKIDRILSAPKSTNGLPKREDI